MAPPAAPRIAFSYTRWSSPEQAKGDTLRRQVEAAERWASQHGYALAAGSTFRDAGVSAFRGKNVAAGALGVFLTAVEAGALPRDCVLLIESLDRLSRLPPLSALDLLRRVTALGVTVVTLHDQQKYTAASLDDDFGKLIIALVTHQRAFEESKTKSTRVSAAWADKRERAATNRTPLGGRCPGWLTLDRASGNGKYGKYVVIPDRAKTVRRIFDLAANGLGQDAISRRFNRENVPTIGQAKKWWEGYVAKILRSDAVIGRYQPHRLVMLPTRHRVPDGPPIEDYFPRVIPYALYAKVRQQRAARRLPGGPRNPETPNVFAGLLRCECGAPVWYVDKGVSRHGKPQRYLACSARKRGISDCAARPRPYAKTETVLLALVSDRLPWDDLIPAAKSKMQTALDNANERLAEVSAYRQSVADRIARIVAEIETGTSSPALTARLGELERQHGVLTNDVDMAESVRDAIHAGLATADETAKRQRDALDAWQRTGRHTSATRARLATALRELLTDIVLHVDHAKVTFKFSDGRVVEVTHVADVKPET